jgi:glycerol uptake facilitator protein
VSAGSIILSEFLGTAVLILFGAGVVANVLLTRTNADGDTASWVLITFGWGLGVFAGASIADASGGAIVLAWLVYKLQFDASEDNSGTLNIFSTNPPIKSPVWNVVTETIATFALVLFLLDNPYGDSPAIYAAAAAVVVGIGQSLGGPTGYAINPARDLGPRIAYAILPIRGKGKPDWAYSWVPVVAPLIGAVLAALVAKAAPVKMG